MLTLVRLAPVACNPWYLRHDRDGEPHPIGSTCLDCGRDVALRRKYHNRDAVCVFCAMERGLVPAIEIEPDDKRYPDEFQEPTP